MNGDFARYENSFLSLANSTSSQVGFRISVLMAGAGESLSHHCAEVGERIRPFPDWMQKPPTGKFYANMTSDCKVIDCNFWETYWWYALVWLSRTNVGLAIVLPLSNISRAVSPSEWRSLVDLVYELSPQCKSNSYFVCTWKEMALASAQMCGFLAGLLSSSPLDGARQRQFTGKPVHAQDFTCVNWYGTEYTFTYVQSQAVKALWSAWESTGLGIHQNTIKNEIDAELKNFRMDKAFRNHPAFGKMIQNMGDAKFKLVAPHQAKEELPIKQQNPLESPEGPL